MNDMGLVPTLIFLIATPILLLWIGVTIITIIGGFLIGFICKEGWVKYMLLTVVVMLNEIILYLRYSENYTEKSLMISAVIVTVLFSLLGRAFGRYVNRRHAASSRENES